MDNQSEFAGQLRQAMSAMLIALATIAPVAQSTAAPEPVTAQGKSAANPCAPTNPCAPKKKPKKPVDEPGAPKPTAPPK